MKTPAHFALTFLTLLATLAGAGAADAKGCKHVSVEAFDKLRADKKAVVLDVRTMAEFDAGHLPGAVNLDWNGPDFARKAAELEKSKIYLVHCAALARRNPRLLRRAGTAFAFIASHTV